MPQSITLKTRGLYTYPNPLSGRPEGSLQIAKNLVIDRQETPEPRRGFTELDYPLGTDTANRADQLMNFGDGDILAHYGAFQTPTKLAFFMWEQQFSGVVTAASNTIADLVTTSGYYSSAIVKAVETQTVFSGTQTLGSTSITDILSTQGLYVGLEIGGLGIPAGTTISSISGTGPYSIVMSNASLAAIVGNTITATDKNLSTFASETRAVVINSSSLVLDNNSPYTSRTMTFLPADVNTTLDTITVANHGLINGQQIQLSTSGTLPAPFLTTAVYYVVESTNNTFRLAATSGGTGINITTQGTGTHTLTVRTLFSIGGWIDLPGTLEKPEGNIKMRYAEQNNSLFITTKDGIRKLDNIKGINLSATVTDGSANITNTDILNVAVGEYVSGPGIPDGSYVVDLLSANSFQINNVVNLPTGVASANNQLILIQPRLAGTAYALDGEAVLTTDFTGFLPTDRAVQYFIVWGYKDANNRIARGAPSGSLGIAVSNSTGSSKNVNIKFTVPEGITPAHFYQVYRSGFSATAQSNPPSEARLIYEANPSFTEIVNKIVTFDDIVPESLRSGEILYTSEGQEGVLLGNYPPPFGTDIASFKNSLFISNTKTKQALDLTILSVSGNFSIKGNTDIATAFKALTVSSPALTITADTLSGSPLISNISTSDMAAVALGVSVTGAGIPANTVVAAYEDESTIRLTNNATATAAAVTITVGITGVAQGQLVSGTPFAAGTKVTEIFTESSATANTTNASPVIFDLPSVAGLSIGQPITAASGITAGTLIQSTYAASSTLFIADNVDITTDTFTIIGHGLQNSNAVTFVGGSLPTPLVTNTVYYVVGATTDTFQVSATLGGGAINITATGSGSVSRSPQLIMTDNATATVAGQVITVGSGFRIDTAATATLVATTVTFTNGTGGIEVGDTITIAGVTYTAGGYEDYSLSNRIFRVYSFGTPAQNITNTALSLIRVVNRQSSAVGTPDVYAQYTSAVNGLPGEIVFQARSFLGGLFYATADSAVSGQAYTPALPAAGGTTVFSENNEFQNGLAFSKTELPEAFPLGYLQQIGNEKQKTIRIVALRDSLFNLKEDGVFRESGEDPTSFRSSIFDNTITLAAQESVAIMDNAIFALSREGVQYITDSKSENISEPIQDLILDIFEQSEDKVRSLSFGFSYDSDRKYILYTIKQSTDTTATQAFVFNIYTQSWTTWEMEKTCGLVLEADDLIYLGNADNNTVKYELKNRRYTDYTDDSFPVDIISVTGVITAGSNQITGILPDTTHLTVGQTIEGTGIPANTLIQSIPSNFVLNMNKNATVSGTVQLTFQNASLLRLNDVSSITVGDVIYQNAGRFSIITEIDTAKNTITTRNPINSWTEGEADILVAIESILQYAPQTCGNPSAVKQVSEFIAMFQSPFFDSLDVAFNTDISGDDETVTLNGQINGVLWGLFPWGQGIWGGQVKPEPMRTYVPRNKQRNTQLNITLTHREAYAFYRLSGIQIFHGSANQRIRR